MFKNADQPSLKNVLNRRLVVARPAGFSQERVAMVITAYRVYLQNKWTLRLEVEVHSSDTIGDLKVQVETLFGFPARMINIRFLGPYHDPLDPDLEYWDELNSWAPDTQKLDFLDARHVDGFLSFYLKLPDPSVVRSAFEAATKVTAMKAKPMKGMDGLPMNGKPMKAKSIKAKSMEEKSMKAKSMKAKTKR